MARPYTAKVGRHVTYYNAARKPRPATITAVGSANSGIVLRIVRSGETKGDGTTGILRSAFSPPKGGNTWTPK